jgi:hypothetical protein
LCPWACWEQLGIAATRVDNCTGRLVTETDDDDGTFERQYNMKKNFFDAQCKLGCKDDKAYNFRSDITTNDGTCVTADTVSFDIVERPTSPEAVVKFEVTVKDHSGKPSNAGRQGLSVFLSHNPRYDAQYFGSYQPAQSGFKYNAELTKVNGIGNYTFSVIPIAAGLYNTSVLLGGRLVPINALSEKNNLLLTPLPAPSFTARVSDTGGRLTLAFDRDTNSGGAPPGSKSCTDLVVGASTGVLGDGPTCVWNTGVSGARELNIAFGKYSSQQLVVGDQLTLAANKVFVAAENSFASTSAVVLAPAIVPIPVVTLNGPTYVSTSGTEPSCDPATLDARASFNSGGRPWKEVVWELKSMKHCDAECTIEKCDGCIGFPDNNTRVMALTSLLQTVSDDKELSTKLALVIPTLANTNFYTFGVMLRNWMGGQAEATIEIIKRGSHGGIIMKPNIVVNGAMRRATTSKDGVTIHVEASISGCYSGDQTIKYQWQASPAISALDLCDRKVSYGTCNTKNLHIAPDTLPAGQNITFTLQASLQAHPDWLNTVQVAVVVEPSPLVANIDKGSRSTSTADSFQLDARPSVDPDAPDDSTSQLAFEWTCTTVEKATCPARILARIRAESTLTFPPSTFAPGERLLFTVVVKKTPFDGRSATQTVTVSVIEGTPPPVELFWVGIAAEAQTTTKANADKLFVLQGPRGPNTPKPACLTGLPSVCAIDEYRWELKSGDILNVDSLASHPMKTPSSELTFLTLPSGTFSPEIFYTFRLHATSFGQTGFADFSVSVNAPPFAGTLEVFTVTKDGTETPIADGASITGGMIYTDVVLKTAHWVDEVR